MNIEEAISLLNGCNRSELRDHAFGDVEVCWYKNDVEIASGYFGGGSADVHIIDGPTFKETEARQLRNCGVLCHTERNDSIGPTEFSEGTILPGLTKEAVFEELTTPPVQ